MKNKLRSEASIKEVIDCFSEVLAANRYDGKDPIVYFYKGKQVIAEINLKDFIKKRKPLTGIKKQINKIVRGSKKK